MERFAEKLKAAMRAKGVGADAIIKDVPDAPSRATIGRWLAGGAGSAKLEDIQRVARFLDVSVDYLIDDRLESPPSAEMAEDERWVLQTVRELGMDRAKARLLGKVRGIDPDDL